MQSAKLDLLVVGAGPTGLTLACEALRHGVTCRVIEELDAPVVHSKAAAVHARTLEVMDDMGVVESILPYAKEIAGLRIYAKEKLVARIPVALDDCAYPHVYGVSQHDTELVLAAHFEKLGGTIERGKKLVSFTQNGSGVRATVSTALGKDETIEARFIAGCDGAHSAVRKTLGFAFEGGSYEEHLIQADMHVDLPNRGDGDEVMAFLSPDGPLAMLPLFRDGRYRLIVFLLPGQPDLEPTLENFQRVVDERGPKGARVSDPAWMVAFKIHHRRSKKYREENAFLAGDAAHIHSPVGGQGMNTGIQDAYNLAWKLALVAKGRANAAILDSYEAEREPIAKALVETTDIATRAVTIMAGFKNPFIVGARNELMSVVTQFEGFRNRMAREISMLDLNYRKSPIVAQDRATVWVATVGTTDASEMPSLGDWALFGDGPAPGDRAPDVILPENKRFARLGDVIRGTKHTLLLFDGAAATPGGYVNLTSIVEQVRARYDDLITCHIVVPYAEKPLALTFDGSIILDDEGVLHRRYGARSECMYLIRPDGYIGYRSQPARAEPLEAYLGKLLTPS